MVSALCIRLLHVIIVALNSILIVPASVRDLSLVLMLALSLQTVGFFSPSFGMLCNFLLQARHVISSNMLSAVIHCYYPGALLVWWSGVGDGECSIILRLNMSYSGPLCLVSDLNKCFSPIAPSLGEAGRPLVQLG